MNKLAGQTILTMIPCLCLFSSLAIVFSDVTHIDFRESLISAVAVSIGVTALFLFSGNRVDKLKAEKC